MTQKAPLDGKPDIQRQLEEYVKPTIDGAYGVETRYDRSALAIAGGGFALFAALLQFDVKPEDITTPASFSGMIYATLLAFIFSIALILAHQVFGSHAHREVLKKVRKAIKMASQGQKINIDLSGGISAKIAVNCFKLSAITMAAGLLMAAIVISTYWWSSA